jgi:multiple sugar transport system substrate-binding protein
MLVLKSFYRKSNIKYIAIALILITFIVACTHTPKSEQSLVTQAPSTEGNVLKIWWEKGFNPEEDEATQNLARNWENKTGNKINLSLLGTDEIPRNIKRAIQAKNLPDIAMTFKADRAPNARLAWEGKLVDLSDVIDRVKDLYSQDTLTAINYYNNLEKKRSYYAVPIHQAANHIHYWKDLLKQVNRTEKDIPGDWDGFWNFWTKVQDDLRAKHQLNIYGLGLPLSAEAADTYVTFEHILEAYNVPILDEKGQLQVDNPQVRQGIIKVLEWYAQFYRKGYIPSDALHWFNPDNNRRFLNHELLMTTNQTLSIPASVHQDLETYYHKLGTLEFPNKPNGQPMRNLIVSDQAIIFAESPHQEQAKDFLRYIIQPEVMAKYLKASGGRYSPVERSIWKTSFWSDSKDPHISIATKTMTKDPTRIFYTFQNPAYSLVLQENVWGKALTRIAKDNISSEQAADEAIARIQGIFSEWKSH